jgi:hypothetical protein
MTGEPNHDWRFHGASIARATSLEKEFSKTLQLDVAYLLAWRISSCARKVACAGSTEGSVVGMATSIMK